MGNLLSKIKLKEPKITNPKKSNRNGLLRPYRNLPTLRDDVQRFQQRPSPSPQPPHDGGEADFMPCFRVRTEPYNSSMRRHCRSTNRQQQDRIIEVAAIKANGFEQADFNLELNKEKRTLRVTAAKEVTSEDRFTVNKKFDKTFEIPEACDIETVKSVLTNRDRVLKIMATVAKTEEEEKDKKEIEGQQQQLEQRKGFSFMNDFLMSNNCGEDNVEDEEAETRMKFDATGFEPEDLKVEVTREGMLKIEAERVVKNEKSGQVESRKHL